MEFGLKWAHMARYELILRLDGAFKRKTANEAKRNETETKHEANKANDMQGSGGLEAPQ